VKSTSLRTVAPLLAGVFLLAGCVSSDMSDLEAYVAEVKARKSGDIEPLPEVKVYEPYIFKGGRDPFEDFYQIAAGPDGEKGDGRDAQLPQEIANRLASERNRNKEELERFELDSLRMVGILEDQSDLWGIIRDQAGSVYRVRVGDHMGRNFGVIVEIREDGIDLQELVQSPNAPGGWEERVARLDLVELEG
jgi:type IV pilus assembly protein PilP